MARRFDRRALIERLEPIRYEPSEDPSADSLEQVGLGGSLLLLARIDHESEFRLCHDVARHLLGEVFEPEDIPLDEA